MKTAIVGATGYTGIVLTQLLLDHPKVELTQVFSQTYAGKKLADVYPQFKGVIDLDLVSFLPDSDIDADVIFFAVPHAMTHAYLPKFHKPGRKIIDLSADYRLTDPETFKDTYQTDHKHPDFLKKVPYGVPELNKEAIRRSDICANPGCYAVNSILALYPLAKEGLLTKTPIIDAKSGVTGAGRKAKTDYLFAEVDESFASYATGTHRHIPEIETVLDQEIYFSPHLVPMRRGMMITAYVQLKQALNQQELISLYSTYYKEAPFVKIMEDKTTLNTKWVVGSNNCLINFNCVQNKGIVVVTAVIDNLLKGAAGSAVQNMNIMCGFAETLGLPQVASPV